MNEVFRFMVFRPPAAVDSNSSKYIRTENPYSVFQNHLKEARLVDDALKASIRVAERFIASETYVSDPHHLIPLAEFNAQLSKTEILDANTLNEVVKKVFHQDAKAVIESEDYAKNRQNIADSILALVIAGKENCPNYEDLVQALRVCNLMERLAAQDPTLNTGGAIEDALGQVVVLPQDIFPLPGPRYSTDVSSKQAKEIREARLEQEKRTREAIQLLGSLRTALDELSVIRSSDFRPVEYQPAEQAIDKPEQVAELRRETVLAPVGRSAWILADKAINSLSETTRQATRELGISLDATPLPEVTHLLEKKLAEASAEVYKAAPPTEIVKIGSTFVPVSTITGDIMAGLGPFQVVYPAVQEATFREVGIDDLMVVREDIQRYEAGEVAHIENVLKGESKKRSHRKTRRTEETYLVETETIQETEKDLQSTERFELQKETQLTIKQESSLDVGVTVKYGGFVDVEASTKYATKDASELSTRTATNYAREVTDRSVSRIRERVRELRVLTTIEEVEEKNLHSVNNTAGPDHVVGIYRWVDKVYNAQILNYGKRTMYEFIVPEPAAFLLYARAKKPVKGVTLTEPAAPMRGCELVCKIIGGVKVWGIVPMPPEPLRPQFIHPYNYQQWVAQYQATDVEPPPPSQIIVPYSWQTAGKKDQGDALVREGRAGQIDIPNGYAASTVHLWVEVLPLEAAPPAHVIPEKRTSMEVVFGSERVALTGYANQYGGYSANLRNLPGKIPVFVQAVHRTLVSVSAEILCNLTDSELDKWRQKTYDAIMTAYLNLKSAYEEQLAAASVQEGIAISGSNPNLNREFEKTELKRGALTLLTRKWWPHLNGVGAIANNEMLYPNQTGGVAGYPEIYFDKANAQLSTIQFLEQAFEWNQMVYTFYPYFWARKECWPTLQQLDDTDPVHARFLKAGAARVLVPVRSGYEDSLRYYWMLGKPWEGQGPPSVGHDSWLPIIDEIKEKYGIYFAEGEGTLAVTKDSPLVKGSAETDFTEDDKDKEIKFEGKTYRIAKINSRRREVTLAENYSGNDKAGISYAISRYKLVGNPWEVKIPTTLVYLEQENVKLPDFTKETK